MFAVATGHDADSGITVDQSGVVLDKWSPPHVVSDGELPLVANGMLSFIQKFVKPHDVTMDTDGSAVYVTEIGPNRIWRFVRSEFSSYHYYL